MYVKLSAFIVLLGLCLVESAPRAPKQQISCERQANRTEKCIKSAILLGLDGGVANFKGQIAPQNVDDMNEHCKRVAKDIRCVGKYGRCMHLFPKTVFNILLANIRKTLKGICRSDESKKEFIRKLECFRSDNIKTVHHVMDELTIIFDYVANNVSQNDMIPLSCCIYYTSINIRARKIIADLCDSDDTSDFIINIVKSVVTDVIDIGCGRYTTQEVCDSLLPEGMKAIVDLIEPASKVTRQSHTVMRPLLKMAGRLDNDFDGL